jgi:hypothetical protein
MCRNIRTLSNFEPPVSRDEIQAAALQYVRKVSGTTHPSKANEKAFARAVQAEPRGRGREGPGPGGGPLRPPLITPGGPATPQLRVAIATRARPRCALAYEEPLLWEAAV